MKLVLPKSIAKLGLQVSKRSPELCMVGAGVCFLGAIVAASHATTKVEEILNEWNDKIEDIEFALKEPEIVESGKYTPEDAKKDKMIVYCQTGANLIKNYALTAALFASGTAFMLSSYKIMSARYSTLLGAYTALQGLFEKYRQNVRNDLGEEKDLDFLYSRETAKLELESTDKRGKVIKKVGDVKVMSGDPTQYSPYARFFDESCSQWKKDHEYNLTYLVHQQAYMNARFNSVGHVFLNEVYDALGIPRTTAGALVGWVKGNGNDYIDFGIFTGFAPNRNFVNGYERVILLDFNVDGLIYDKI